GRIVAARKENWVSCYHLRKIAGATATLKSTRIWRRRSFSALEWKNKFDVSRGEAKIKIEKEFGGECRVGEMHANIKKGS
ncbi:hypothetical protein MKX01_033459, partial [Papaver californicum]